MFFILFYTHKIDTDPCGRKLQRTILLIPCRLEQIDNIVGKEENPGHHHFFPQ